MVLKTSSMNISQMQDSSNTFPIDKDITQEGADLLPEVFVVDTQYVLPEFAAIYIIKHQEDVGIVESGTTHSAKLVIDFLKSENISVSNVKWIALTHVHLDHAGGAGELIKYFPNAKVIGHPKTIKHLIQPDRLIASAQQVYGVESFSKLYGTIIPVEAEKTRSVEDGDSIKLGGTELKVLETLGHASHHVCFFEPKTRTLFSGDSFGLAYPTINSSRIKNISHEIGFCFPSTSPSDFDPDLAIQVIKRLIELEPHCIALTHYSLIEGSQKIIDAGAKLVKWLEASKKVMNQYADDPYNEFKFLEWGWNRIEQMFLELGIPLNEDLKKYLRLDIELNAKGMKHYLERKKAK